MLDNYITEYNDAIYDTDRDQALNVVHKALTQGVTPEEVVFGIVLPAMDKMLESIGADLDTNLAQQFMTAQIADTIVTEMISKFKKIPEIAGTVILGTAYGDMHSLGKRIVTGCLKARFIDVIDIGVNVTPKRFVDEAVAKNANVIGISAMMLHTARGEQGCIGVRQILKERRLEDKIKLIVGGAPYRFDNNLYKTVQADAYAADAVNAGKLIAELMEKP